MELETNKLSRAEINRLNALKSTGPKTEAGKRKASLNALRHGLTGQTVVLPTEDLEQYNRFIEAFHKDLKPKGMLEEQLAQSIADDAWRLHRARALENNLFALGIDEKAESIQTENSQVQIALAMAAALREQTQALSTLSMHTQRISRQFERNVEQFRKTQAERREREQWDLYQASKLLLLHEAEQKRNPSTDPPQAYNPAEDGFVFSVEEIDTYLDRKFRRNDADTYWALGKLPKQAA